MQTQSNPVIVAVMTSFNGEQYVSTGRSYGSAQVPGNPNPVFVGTDNRVKVRIVNDEVVLGLLGSWDDYDQSTLTRDIIGLDKEIVIGVIKPGSQGLRAMSWCLKRDWDNAVQELAARKATREELEKQRLLAIAAETKHRGETNPSTPQEALRHGWTLAKGNGEYGTNVYHRPLNDGTDRKASKTFNLGKPPKQNKSQRDKTLQMV